jgi:hypothetical protein
MDKDLKRFYVEASIIYGVGILISLLFYATLIIIAILGIKWLLF